MFIHNRVYGKLTLGRAGGNKMIISSMQKHSEHAGVQEQACGALANLGVHQQNMATWQHLAACCRSWANRDFARWRSPNWVGSNWSLHRWSAFPPSLAFKRSLPEESWVVFLFSMHPWDRFKSRQSKGRVELGSLHLMSHHGAWVFWALSGGIVSYQVTPRSSYGDHA